MQLRILSSVPSVAVVQSTQPPDIIPTPSLSLYGVAPATPLLYRIPQIRSFRSIYLNTLYSF